MKRKRFTEEQIIDVLKQSDAGVDTGDLCRQNGISKNTLYNWRKKFGALGWATPEEFSRKETRLPSGSLMGESACQAV